MTESEVKSEYTVKIGAHSPSFEALGVMFALRVNYPDIPYPLPPIIVMTAFTIEGYLNEIGCHLRPQLWQNIEKSPWRLKVELIHEFVQSEAKWGEDPLQFMIDVFKGRDRLAHGKPVAPQQWLGPTVDPLSMPTAASFDPGLSKYNEEWFASAETRLENTLKYFARLVGLPEFHAFYLTKVEIADLKTGV